MHTSNFDPPRTGDWAEGLRHKRKPGDGFGPETELRKPSPIRTQADRMRAAKVGFADGCNPECPHHAPEKVRDFVATATTAILFCAVGFATAGAFVWAGVWIWSHVG
jgi:hypothetical protein